MRTPITALCLLMASSAMSLSAQSTRTARAEFLDAIRPEATRRARQPVRFKVDHLNIESGWAVLVGELVSPQGTALDWAKTDCEPELDKMLWVVARKTAAKWTVTQMQICASEPPYWYLEPKDYERPCGIYAGLEVTGSSTAEEQCRAYVRRRAVRPRRP